MVKKPPADAADITDSGGSLGWNDPLEEGPAAHSSVLTWRSPRTGESGRLQL